MRLMSVGFFLLERAGIAHNNTSHLGGEDMKKEKPNPKDCPHTNTRKEFLSGQRTGELECVSCGKSFRNNEEWESEKKKTISN